ncbi:TadE/TadG family type IV pilus assembly protein [Marinactinospora thermotolerans]|uniref:TadE/TadG family type IV pilus assembly protein n=1 Tax=Marinactinospora thermotolerans TaxID=531310 RepID=UPI003D9037AE
MEARQAPLRPPRGRPRDDRGSQILEFAAYFPLFLIMVAVALEVFICFVAVERAEHAARAGARVAGTQGLTGSVDTARRALPDWLDEAEITSGPRDDGGYYTEVRVDLPVAFQIADLDITITRRVDMPV